MLDPNKIWLKKVGQKSFGQKSLCSKKFMYKKPWVQKNLGPTIFLVQQFQVKWSGST